MIFIATDSAQASTSAAALNGQKHQQSAEAASGQPLLAVDPRKLRGEEEMRRIFGARTMREEERDNANAGDQHPVSRSVAHLALAVFGSMAHELMLAICHPEDGFPQSYCTQNIRTMRPDVIMASMPIACFCAEWHFWMAWP